MTSGLLPIMPQITATEVGFSKQNSHTNNTLVSGKGAPSAQGIIVHVPQDTGFDHSWWKLVIRDENEPFPKLTEQKLNDFVSRQLWNIIKWSKMVQSHHFFRRSHQDRVSARRGMCWMVRIGHRGQEKAVPKVDGEEIAWFCKSSARKYQKMVKNGPISPFFSQILSSG